MTTINQIFKYKKYELYNYLTSLDFSDIEDDINDGYRGVDEMIENGSICVLRAIALQYLKLNNLLVEEDDVFVPEFFNTTLIYSEKSSTASEFKINTESINSDIENVKTDDLLLHNDNYGAIFERIGNNRYCEALLKNPTIKSLDVKIEDNYSRDEIKLYFNTIKKTNIEHLSFYIYDGNIEMCKIAFESLIDNYKIKSLALEFDTSMEILLPYFIDMIELNLSITKITLYCDEDDIIENIYEVLKKNKILKKFVLCNLGRVLNEIEMGYIINIIETNNTIEKIKIKVDNNNDEGQNSYIKSKIERRNMFNRRETERIKEERRNLNLSLRHSSVYMPASVRDEFDKFLQ